MDNRIAAGTLVLANAFGAVVLGGAPTSQADFSTFRFHYNDEETAVEECARTVQETGQTLIFNRDSESCMGTPGYEKSDLHPRIKDPVFTRDHYIAYKVRESAVNCFTIPHNITMYNPETGTCSYLMEP
jgi:hypothetical protein